MSVFFVCRLSRNPRLLIIIHCIASIDRQAAFCSDELSKCWIDFLATSSPLSSATIVDEIRRITRPFLGFLSLSLSALYSARRSLSEFIQTVDPLKGFSSPLIIRDPAVLRIKCKAYFCSPKSLVVHCVHCKIYWSGISIYWKCRPSASLAGSMKMRLSGVVDTRMA